MKAPRLIHESEIALVEDKLLNIDQLNQLFKHTPAEYTHKRPAKGGGTWTYVTGGYVKKVLNLMFGFNWDFEVVSNEIIGNEVVVLGRLTCRNSNGDAIIKMQFGNKEIMYRKQNETQKSQNLDRVPLSIGNDIKAATTDCLKKCAAEIGIASDIYNPEEFRQVEVIDNKIDKEKYRIEKFINKAKTIADLEKIKGDVPQDLMDLWQEKYIELTPKNKGL